MDDPVRASCASCQKTRIANGATPRACLSIDTCRLRFANRAGTIASGILRRRKEGPMGALSVVFHKRWISCCCLILVAGVGAAAPARDAGVDGKESSPTPLDAIPWTLGAMLHESDLENGVTLLHAAVAHDANSDAPSTDIVRRLLESGADPNARDDFGRTPAFYCALSSSRSTETQVAKLMLLVEHGADLSIRDFATSATALHFATIASTPVAPAIVVCLCRLGMDPNVADAKGRTPLHWAAANGCEGWFPFLVENDDLAHWVDCPRSQRHGLLVVQIDVVRQLLRLGASVSRRDQSGALPIATARSYGYPYLLDLLKSGDPEAPALPISIEEFQQMFKW